MYLVSFEENRNVRKNELDMYNVHTSDKGQINFGSIY